MVGMTQRVNIGVFPESDWQSIRKQLQSLGASEVREPDLLLPDVLIVALPAERDLDKFVASAKGIKGVRYAEADAWQQTF